MGLKDTLKSLRDVFQKREDNFVDRVAMDKDRVKAEAERYLHFTQTVVLQAIDELNNTPGLRLHRIWVKQQLLYAVIFDFVPQGTYSAVFSIENQPQNPLKIEAAYSFGNTPKDMKKFGAPLLITDDSQRIIDILEQGIKALGPK